jgi:hypothetical protein
MERAQALLAAEAADTIVGFIHRVHRQDRGASPAPQLTYEDNGDFNDSVDEVHDAMRIYDFELRPSEILFRMEPDSYRVYLAEFVAQGQEFDAGASRESVE